MHTLTVPPVVVRKALVASLTWRERTVAVALVANPAGTERRFSNALGIALNRFRNIRKVVFEKLAVTNRAHLVSLYGEILIANDGGPAPEGRMPP